MEILKGALVLGGATLVAGAALQAIYKKTGYYPPDWGFWFATGAVGYLALEAVEHVVGQELVTNKTHLLPS